MPKRKAPEKSRIHKTKSEEVKPKLKRKKKQKVEEEAKVGPPAKGRKKGIIRKTKRPGEEEPMFPMGVTSPQPKAHKVKKIGVAKGNTLTIHSWNINGIRAVTKSGHLQNFIKEVDPSILCLNETKIQEKDLEPIKKLIPKEYHQYWNCSTKPAKLGYAGTAIFSKVEPIGATYDIPGKENRHLPEGRVITLEYEKFYLIATYIPNASQGLVRLEYRLNTWDVDFQEYTESLRANGKSVVICGDLNVCHHEIDIAKPKSNLRSAGFTIEERNSFSAHLKLGYHDTFRELHPTLQKFSYWNQKSNCREQDIGWRLDYFVVSDEMNQAVLDSDMLQQYYGSDHCPLFLDLDEGLIDAMSD